MTRRDPPRWTWLLCLVLLFFLSAVAAGAAAAFLPQWTVLVVVLVSGYGLWQLSEWVRRP